MQVIDYCTNRPLHTYLAKHYGDQPFDYILDTIGIQDLFTHSQAYLKPDGALINLGNFEGPGLTVWRSILNTYLPVILGGVPRKYAMMSTTPNGEKTAELAKMVDNSTLRVVADEIDEISTTIRHLRALADVKVRL